MKRNEAGSRISSLTSSSTDSARSSITIKPLPATPTDDSPRPTPRRAVPTRLKTDDNVKHGTRPKKETTTSETLASPASTNSNVSLHMMSELANYRRELAILDAIGGPRFDKNAVNNPATGSLSCATSFLSGTGTNSNNTMAANSAQRSQSITSFYNDSSDNLSATSQSSPSVHSGLRSGTGRPGGQPNTAEIPDATYFDERRPSVASVTTTASTGSKASGNTRGGYKKLQGFFGAEFPGRDSSESSLATHPGPGKERSQSYGQRSHRDRNYSNATDHTREASPSSSRPRTPVPTPEVVPFLYQEPEDIARYGEAPVRDILSGPDRDRYVHESLMAHPPKTSSSSRSGQSVVHLHGHHRHNKSTDDPRVLRPSVSREESMANIPKDRSVSAAAYSRSRAHSPAPSSKSQRTGKNGTPDSQNSPDHHKKPILGGFRFGRGRKERDESAAQALKKLPSSSTSLNSRAPTRQELPRIEGTSPFGADWPGFHEPRDVSGPGSGAGAQASRQGHSRQPTANKFFKKTRSGSRPYDDAEEFIGPTDRQEPGTIFHLDTNLGNMEGIVSRPLPMTPMDADFKREAERQSIPQEGGLWNAPDSWAVRKGDEPEAAAQDENEIGSPPRPEEKLAPHCIRVFRSDGTFATLQMSLEATVQEVIGQLVKKSYVTDGAVYHIVLKKHDLVRVLTPLERPLLIQKRLLQQIGYEDRDRIDDLGREDNSYLCRFLFLSARESDFHATTHDLGLGRMQKFNHVDLSARNLITVPITLYSKAGEIISLNLSRNLSLDLPRDFIGLCTNLRDIKLNNNEARKLPPSLSRAHRLTYLDISNNRLEQLEHAELSKLTGLLKLNLANNRLKHLPPYFDGYIHLRTLNISSNFVEKFPKFLCELESLVDLDLSFNLIGSFPDEIGKLRNLEKFVITNNRLSGALPNCVKHLVSLRELDIKYNAITGIDVISELPKLEILAADHNAISQFVGSFERIRSLKLNANPITKFEIHAPAPTLKVLNLSHAQLASIDESFNNLTNLERLVLDKNYFVSLPIQIGNLKRLEHFSIANNAIGELPAEIGCLTELKVLDVRNNNIRKLPMELWWANKLETLNASSNVLDNFPKPASRPPQPPGNTGDLTSSGNGKNGSLLGSLSKTPSAEDMNAEGNRRPSQASSSLLSVGPSPVPGPADRKTSMVSVYGKGGRKTSVITRCANSASGVGSLTSISASRKDSGLSQRLTNTFAGSLRNLCLADNLLDDDVFDQVTLLSELRVLNLSYNDLSDMPQRSIKSWPQLVELYLSGNELSSLPADDLEEYSLLQVLHINGNKFTNLPADISRAKKLAVLDCGCNMLKYNISNVPYDWNWNLNPNLRYLNLSGNRKLEIKQAAYGAANREQYTDFSSLANLRMLGLMDVTLTQPSIPDETEDRRVRTSGSIAGNLPYGMADTLGKNEHLSTIDLVVPRFNSTDTDTLLGLFDGQALSSGGSKIAKYLHENFGHVFSEGLKGLKGSLGETPEDALRRAFLGLDKDLVTVATQHTNPQSTTHVHRGSSTLVLNKEDLNSGGVATIVYLQGQELYVANVGDIQAMLVKSDGTHKFLTKRHDPAEPTERSRIRDAGGWVSRNGRLNDLLEVSRAFGYVDLMPAVQAAPHVSHVTIKDTDETVMLATHHLWEYLSPEHVVDIAHAERDDLMKASQKLRDLAIAYGATNKIMIMMMSVTDLKRRNERIRQPRGTTLSWYPNAPLELPVPARRPKQPKASRPLDSTLLRLEAEVPPPTGLISIVFTDIKNSTNLWDVYPAAMRAAIRLHNDVMRRQLRVIGGFEVKTEGDAFMVSFPTATSALLWTFAVQTQLLEVNWPPEILNSVHCQPSYDKDDKVIFKGLSVRMGIHWGEPLAEPDPVTRRMDYYGPMVNKASRVSAVADGGQIAVSSDFISEIQRCLETYQDGSPVEHSDQDQFAKSIRNELRSLSSQGFEVKEMGERKLKGLENPEFVYSLYPHSLVGRIDMHNDRAAQASNPVERPPTVVPGGELSIDPESVWALWKVSLRLEMLCSVLEEVTGRGLQPPETELLERMKQRGGEVTERFVVNFLEHQVSRIETCVTTLSLRHMTSGGGHISQLNDLRAPMSLVLDSVAAQLAELERYKLRYGSLDGPTVRELSDMSESSTRSTMTSNSTGSSIGDTTSNAESDA